MKQLKMVIALLIAIGCIAAIVIINRQQSAPQAQPKPHPRATAKPRGQITVTRSDEPTTAPTRRAAPRKTIAPVTDVSSEPEPSPTPRNDTAEIEREAREALPHVGADTAATNIWLEAINHPEITAATRADLIAGLVEEGFGEGNLDENDLALIQARMQLIERILPQAIDETNTQAFTEVHRLLQNAAERLAQEAQQQQDQQ